VDKGGGIEFIVLRPGLVAHGQHGFYNAHHPLIALIGEGFDPKRAICATLDYCFTKLTHLPEEFSL